jgi:uncharacterized protein YcbK (DUF882 family)
MKKQLLILGSTVAASVGIYKAAQFFTTPVNKEIEPAAPLDYGNGYNEMNFHNVAHFSKSEFHGESEFVDSRVIYALDELRKQLGKPIIISPVKGSVARFDDGSKTSQHYAVGRKSTAVDVLFPESSLHDVFVTASTITVIGGIGLYPDWNPHHGAHIDTRQRKPNGGVYNWMGIDTENGQKLAAVDFNVINERKRQRA